MTIEEFYKLDSEFIDNFTNDEGYRINQYSVIINGESRMVFICPLTHEVEVY